MVEAPKFLSSPGARRTVRLSVFGSTMRRAADVPDDAQRKFQPDFSVSTEFKLWLNINPVSVHAGSSHLKHPGGKLFLVYSFTLFTRPSSAAPALHLSKSVTVAVNSGQVAAVDHEYTAAPSQHETAIISACTHVLMRANPTIITRETMSYPWPCGADMVDGSSVFN